MSKGKLNSLGIREQIQYVYDIAKRKGGGTITNIDYNTLTNKPTKTSDFTNDGEDGTAPFTTLSKVELAGFVTSDWVNSQNFTTSSSFKTINGNTITGTGDLVVGGTVVVNTGSNTVGIRLANPGPSGIGTLGQYAVDLSYHNSNTGYGSTSASGQASFVTNRGTSALAFASSAFGSYTTAWARYQVCIGSCNTVSTTDTSPGGDKSDSLPVFTVGNGHSQGERSNAYQLYRSGRSEQVSDFEITTIGKGVILSSPTGLRYKTTISSDGSHEIREIASDTEVFNSKIRNQRNAGGIEFWTGTQAEYDALVLPDPDTLYFIKD